MFKKTHNWSVADYSEVETLPPKFADYTQVETLPPKFADYSHAETLPPKFADYSHVEALPLKFADYSHVETLPLKFADYSHVETLPPKIANYSKVQTLPSKFANYSQVKTPPPKCATYSQTSHRHQSVPDLHKCKHYHPLASHAHPTVCLTGAVEDSRLQRLSSKHVIVSLSHWSKETNCWCHEFWLTASLQSHFQCNILIIKMYTESKATWTVGETLSFYFRLCSVIYLFPSGVTNNWPTSQLTNQLTTHQVTNNHNICKYSQSKPTYL